MTDREKVIQGLKCCLETQDDIELECCRKCPYQGEDYCSDALMKDALALLREIRPHLSNTEDKDKPLRIMIHSCGAVIVYRGHDVCPHCGKKVDWDV